MTEYAEVFVSIVADTEDAVLCEHQFDKSWIPRSVIEGGDDLSTGDAQDILVAVWFAEKEGLV